MDPPVDPRNPPGAADPAVPAHAATMTTTEWTSARSRGCGHRGAAGPAATRAELQTMPSSSALSTARVRSRTPSLERMLDTWFFTVPSATRSELAISLLL